MPEMPSRLPDFVDWPTFPFVGELRVRSIEEPGAEPARQGEDSNACPTCDVPDEAYIWVNERWRVRATATPPGLPMVLILEPRSHLDLGDLSNLLAAELGVMTVRLERAVRSLDGVVRVNVNHAGDGDAHLHIWFFARPQGQLQLRGPFLSLWDDILPPIDEAGWRENLALIAAWLAEFGGRALAEPPRINWQAPSSLNPNSASESDRAESPSTPATVVPGGVSPGPDATPIAVPSGPAAVPGGVSPGPDAASLAAPSAPVAGPVLSGGRAAATDSPAPLAAPSSGRPAATDRLTPAADPSAPTGPSTVGGVPVDVGNEVRSGSGVDWAPASTPRSATPSSGSAESAAVIPRPRQPLTAVTPSGADADPTQTQDVAVSADT